MNKTYSNDLEDGLDYQGNSFDGYITGDGNCVYQGCEEVEEALICVSSLEEEMLYE